MGTLVLVEDGEGGGGVVGVPQPHGAVGGAGQQALVGAAVHQPPHRVCVSGQRPPQDRWLCDQRGGERYDSNEGCATNMSSKSC